MSKHGKVVVLEAVDWAMNYNQVDADTEFKPILGMICGFLVKETKKNITLTQQWFVEESQVRQTITIPKKNILHRTDLKLVPK